MGISSALYSGVSGLNTNSQAMSVIGNNLANTNTLGFKGARTIFSDLLSSTINGSGGISQVGRGVNVSKVDNQFSQGTFESTETNTDVAIEGDGFFMLMEVGDDTMYYSRAGAFRFDEDGYLVNPEGYRVQGRQYDKDGKLVPGDPGNIQVENEGLTKAQATTTVTLNTNLDASSENKDPAAFDYTNPDTYNYSSSTTVYDTLGNPHLMTFYFLKDQGANNTWQYYWTAEDGSGSDPAVMLGQTAVGAAPAGQLDFDGEGNLDETVNAAEVNITPTWNNGSVDTQMTVSFETTQFDSESTVISQDQNGYAAGNLTDVGIDDEGAVVATYSNGKQTKIAHLTLAKFTNPGGLEMSGSNLYVANGKSGVARIGIPGSELGKIFTNSLEQSNVDMGQQFVKMITVQRGFQANSKIITTVDELLGELINLKR